MRTYTNAEIATAKKATMDVAAFRSLAYMIYPVSEMTLVRRVK